eukprot:gnl/TRDRNA2_/TRDRNA2_84720_c0_seq1.p1 gnl/TRDRNA2_/TRDRNA2_84720_c0~~gnl/TRDRNA2_/TRDRNA2_84720_c0_seq1.p1  ORF type:complete len:198 (+),score=18.95 gnl/TRDRNA2_/TRDRNA2_84720_c0_seq1:41-634(+)
MQVNYDTRKIRVHLSLPELEVCPGPADYKPFKERGVAAADTPSVSFPQARRRVRSSVSETPGPDRYGGRTQRDGRFWRKQDQPLFSQVPRDILNIVEESPGPADYNNLKRLPPPALGTIAKARKPKTIFDPAPSPGPADYRDPQRELSTLWGNIGQPKISVVPRSGSLLGVPGRVPLVRHPAPVVPRTAVQILKSLS